MSGQPWTMERIKELARSKGIECLSGEYILGKKLTWKCSKGHIWNAIVYSIANSNSLCPHCARCAKRTIEELKECAIKHGGLCLSDVYVNSLTKYKWQCAEGHIWEAISGPILNMGTWCPTCVNNNMKLHIEEMEEYAKGRGGLLISKENISGISKLTWQCGEGHQWTGQFSYMKNRGAWCPFCAILNKTYSIEEVRKIAESKGGLFLSDKYINNHTKSEWQCDKGHRWFAIPASIITFGSWCPVCNRSTSIREEECREIFERLLNGKFSSCRPSWLKSPFTTYNLELDGFDGKNLAFEYNGEWHYISGRLQCEVDLEIRKQLDEIKVNKCKEMKILLIVVPYTVKNLEEFIISELKKNNIKIKESV